MKRSAMPPRAALIARSPEAVRAWRSRSVPLGRNTASRGAFTPASGTGKSAAGKGSRIKAVSDKRRAENRERAAMADRRWPDRREGTVMCAVPGCPRPADDLHEILTRARGGSITDEANTVPVCRQHNGELTLEPDWGSDLGLLRHSWDAEGAGAA